jgi:hypothetical protein
MFTHIPTAQITKEYQTHNRMIELDLQARFLVLRLVLLFRKNLRTRLKVAQQLSIL